MLSAVCLSVCISKTLTTLVHVSVLTYAEESLVLQLSRVFHPVCLLALLAWCCCFRDLAVIGPDSDVLHGNVTCRWTSNTSSKR